MGELLENISAEEFCEWQEYYNLYPFGEEINNYRFGLIPASIYNVNRGKASDKLFSPEDFFPKVEREVQTVEEQKELFRKFKTTLGLKH